MPTEPIESLARLKEQFQALPGIGPRSAERLTFHVLREPRTYAVDSRGRVYATPGHCAPWVEVARLPNDCRPVAMLDGDVAGSVDIAIACVGGDVFVVSGNFPNISLTFCSNVFE